MSLLELKDVSMAYNGKVMALQHITMSVEKGEWVAIMGPSGSGKTTLMNIIGCMDHATGGSVVLDGIDLRNSTDAELTEMRRSKIGMVFQQFHLIPYLLSQYAGQKRSYGNDGTRRSEGSRQSFAEPAFGR